MLRRFRLIIYSVTITLLSSCATEAPKDGPPPTPIDLSQVQNAVPKIEPFSHYGNSRTYTVDGQTYHVLASANGYNQRGIASWYGTKFQGELTSSREPYNLYDMTAASKSLPIPCYVKVTNLENGKWVVVKVNDRGPFVSDRIIDLSYAAASKLGYADKGTAFVQVTAINPYTWNKPKSTSETTLAQSKKPSKHTASRTIPQPSLAAQLPSPTKAPAKNDKLESA